MRAKRVAKDWLERGRAGYSVASLLAEDHPLIEHRFTEEHARIR
jgi:hypothetical protein